MMPFIVDSQFVVEKLLMFLNAAHSREEIKLDKYGYE